MSSILKFNGLCYVGQVLDNKAEGCGVAFNDKMFIRTRWKAGKIVSNVEIYYGCNEEYSFFQGSSDSLDENFFPHGEGSITFKSGNYYCGTFENGLFSGRGTMYYPKNKEEGKIKALSFSGIWKNNKIEGLAEIIYDNGDKFVGNFAKSIRSGYGKHFSKENYDFECNWRDNIPYGTAKVYLDDKLYEHPIIDGKIVKNCKTVTDEGKTIYGRIFNKKFIPERVCETVDALINFKKRRIE